MGISSGVNTLENAEGSQLHKTGKMYEKSNSEDSFRNCTARFLSLHSLQYHVKFSKLFDLSKTWFSIKQG